MKVKDWQKATQLVRERRNQTATADTSELSSFSLSELPVDQSGPPTMIHGPYVPLSTSTPVHVPSGNQQTTEATQDEMSFRQVIPNIPQQSLYPSLAAMGSSLNTSISPSIPLSRRVIEEHQRQVLDSYVEGMERGMNTSPIQSLDEQQDEIQTTSKGQKPVVTQAELQEETLQPESPETEDTSMKQADPTGVQAQGIKENEVPVAEDTSEQQEPVANTDSQVEEEQPDPDIPEDQTSRVSQDDNDGTAIDNDEQDDTIQFSNPVTQLFLSRSVRVPITEVGCEPPAIALPISQSAGAVPGLYSHIAQSQDQDSTSLPKPFKSARGHGGKKSKGKAKSQQ